MQVGTRHIANSCAALRFPETRLDAVRVGSALVGSLIAESPVPLKTPHVFKAQVVALKELKKGDTMGYASVYKAKKDMTVAVVAALTSIGHESVAPVESFAFTVPLRNPATPVGRRTEIHACLEVPAGMENLTLSPSPLTSAPETQRNQAMSVKTTSRQSNGVSEVNPATETSHSIGASVGFKTLIAVERVSPRIISTRRGFLSKADFAGTAIGSRLSQWEFFHMTGEVYPALRKFFAFHAKISR
ncbi:MAG: hypothetical protein IIW14_00950 [Kiritimatiellae bacterium]|nr:hypothetical protein [Kiritimatiellia bacterium]